MLSVAVDVSHRQDTLENGHRWDLFQRPIALFLGPTPHQLLYIMLLTNLVLFASLFGAVLAVVPPAQPAINVQVHPNGRSHLCLAAASATEGGATFLRGCRGGDDTMAQWTVSNRTTYLRLTGTQWCLSIGTDFGAGYQPYNGDTDMVLAKCPTSGIPGPLASFPGQTWIYGGSGTSSQDCHFRMVHSGYSESTATGGSAWLTMLF